MEGVHFCRRKAWCFPVVRANQNRLCALLEGSARGNVTPARQVTVVNIEMFWCRFRSELINRRWEPDAE